MRPFHGTNLYPVGFRSVHVRSGVPFCVAPQCVPLHHQGEILPFGHADVEYVSGCSCSSILVIKFFVFRFFVMISSTVNRKPDNKTANSKLARDASKKIRSIQYSMSHTAREMGTAEYVHRFLDRMLQ